MQQGVKSYHCKMQRGKKKKFSGNISPLHHAAVRFHLPQHDAVGMQRGVKSYHCIMQWGVNLAGGVKSKNFRRLSGPLQGQYCQRSHMGELHYPTPMRIMY
jgi:hypothetical protein